MAPRTYDLNTIGGRLGHLIDQSPLTRSALAAKLGVAPSRITDLVKERDGPPKRDTLAWVTAPLELRDAERDWLEDGRGATPLRDGTKVPEPVNGLDSILADYFRGVDKGLDQTALFDYAVVKLQQIVPSATRRQAETVLKITLSAHRQALQSSRGDDSKSG